MNKDTKFLLNIIINLIVWIFIGIVAIVLTLDFIEIISTFNGEIFLIILSIIWEIGLMIVLFKAYSVNWGFIK